jgi:hypothetical protein
MLEALQRLTMLLVPVPPKKATQASGFSISIALFLKGPALLL